MSASSGDILAVAKKYEGDPVVKYIVSIIENNISQLIVMEKPIDRNVNPLVYMLEKSMQPNSGFSFPLSMDDMVVKGAKFSRLLGINHELIGVLVVYLREHHGTEIDY